MTQRPGSTGNGDVARLRRRIGELDRRREQAVERVALFPNSVTQRQLEAMRFELAELRWRLDEIDGAL